MIGANLDQLSNVTLVLRHPKLPLWRFQNCAVMWGTKSSTSGRKLMSGYVINLDKL